MLFEPDEIVTILEALKRAVCLLLEAIIGVLRAKNH